MSGDCRREPTSPTLPAWNSMLVVVAHPDDESFGLGAVLDAFGRAGTQISVLRLTHGEASTMHVVAGNLAEVRVGNWRPRPRYWVLLTSGCC
jgi:LmbE family N-acetylglucosaminyl deacetylase